MGGTHSHNVVVAKALMPDKKAPAGNPPPRPRSNPVTGCPLTAALAAIGGKWKMIILYWLADEPAHFAALRRKMSGISQKVLTQQLRELQADGLVHRRAAERLAQPVVYSLTPYGRSLMPLIESVRRWGRAHLGRSR
jgi:DNA-binding HxlR family transcriptional regulator